MIAIATIAHIIQINYISFPLTLLKIKHFFNTHVK